ncbi:MAG: hydrogenase accessory protein HypB [Clostridiales bacterium GWE2_32_10]|nr:MAG: hydrogenase accessory protein HypB [Clostridiales bacterium GWE2_32_10]HBY19824.1 hydrogenase accessory protein HypB [Clostridiales bacterium]
MKSIVIEKNILKNNNEIASKIRSALNDKGIYTINMIGSPGSGKTSVLEQIIKHINRKFNIAVIEGDLYTTKDAERIENQGINVVQLNTEGACHLDANMIEQALDCIDINNADLLVIENVGNLVCPASYDLSEDSKILVMSVTEGHDKPLKYPSMFQKAEVLILNKIDLVRYTNFDIGDFYKDVKSLNEHIHIFEISCTSGKGVQKLCDYLEGQIMSKGVNR